MIPARVAIALQDDGWWLRDEIVWHKPNPMPSSVTDRTTPAHEMIYLLTRSARYFYDQDAIKEPSTGEKKTGAAAMFKRKASKRGLSMCPNSPMPTHRSDREAKEYNGDTRNKRSVWTISTKPYPKAHFATFPPEIPRLCILAGSRPGDMILDPFGGSGTTNAVAEALGRNSIYIDQSPEYLVLAKERVAKPVRM